MPQRTKGRLTAAIFAAGLLGGLVLGSPSALADPEEPAPPAPVEPGPELPPPPPDPFAFPPPPDPFAPPPDQVAPQPFNPFAPPPAAIPAGTPAGQDPTPFVGQPPFVPPSFNPVNGAMVGVAKPIIINFQRPIADR